MAGIFALFGVPFSAGVITAILFRIVYYFIPFVISLALYWSLLREKAAEYALSLENTLFNSFDKASTLSYDGLI